MPYDTQSGRAVRLERGSGTAELVFAARGPETALAHLFQHDPCRILFPKAETGDPKLAVLVTTSGGLAGGDRLYLSFRAGKGTAATVTTQAAEKVYRSLEGDCRIDASIGIDGAWLEWLPQETILFEGARLDRRTVVEIAGGGKFLGCEMLVFGRRARGERMTRGLLHEAWQVRRGPTLIWHDALRLEGDIGALLDQPMTFGGAESLATAIYAGEDAALLQDAAHALLGGAKSRSGATLVNGVLIARFLGKATQVRGDLTTYLAGLRQVLGLPNRLPRVWHH